MWTSGSPWWEDLTAGEPCIYITPDSVFVGTRHKRALCKNTGGPLKTVKDVEKFISELKPDAPLKSVSFGGNEPPACNAYNVILVRRCRLNPVFASLTYCNTPCVMLCDLTTSFSIEIAWFHRLKLN